MRGPAISYFQPFLSAVQLLTSTPSVAAPAARTYIRDEQLVSTGLLITHKHAWLVPNLASWRCNGEPSPVIPALVTVGASDSTLQVWGSTSVDQDAC